MTYCRKLNNTQTAITDKAEYVDQAIAVTVMLQKGDLWYYPERGTELNKSISKPISVEYPKMVDTVMTELDEANLPEGVVITGVEPDESQDLQGGIIAPVVSYTYTESGE